MVTPDELVPGSPAAGRIDPLHAAATQQRLAVIGLFRMLGARDLETAEHGRRVARLALVIARELDWGHPAPERLAAAALLHDVGKALLPDTVLRKPGQLDEREWALVRTHPTVGRDILCRAGLDCESEWVLHHHERFDGSGYPDGLAGEEIPIESRLIFVADAFDAITADRPYEPGRPVGAALDEIERGAGSQFDPACAAAAIRAVAVLRPY